MDTLLASIGQTPLLRIQDTEADAASRGAQVFAKAEFMNPSGSIKDRAAAAIVKKAIQSGQLIPGQTLLDSTSGNTGIAYAMLGAMLHFQVCLCMPQNINADIRDILRAFRAEIMDTDPLLGSDGAQTRAEELARRHPSRYFYADQYNSEENWRTHFESTGTEIWWQTSGRTTHFVAGLGTSGTFTGVSRKLKEYCPGTQCIAVQPDSPLHGIEGIKDLSVTRAPGFFDSSLADRIVRVSTERAKECARWLASSHGLFVGISSGANVAAALEVASALPSDAVVVTVLCDNGMRYMGAQLWDMENTDVPGKRRYHSR
jgi:cysteine synthase B